MAYNTIKITKHSDVIMELEAHETIYPGSLVKLNSDNEVALHTTTGSNVIPVMFVLEDELQGRGIDTPYAAGDMALVWIPGRGDIVLGILADGQDVSIGDVLESNGAGFLIAHVADVGDSTTGTVQDATIGISLVDLDASADSSGQDMGAGYGINKRIPVLIK